MTMIKTTFAMMLAAAFLISARPALAGDDKPKTEKSDKAAKGKKDDKKDDKAATPPADKKAEKGGW